MKKELRNYIQYYIGQEISTYWGEQQEIETIRGFIYPFVVLEFNEDNIESSVDISFKSKKSKEPKLILRPLSDGSITKEEYKHIREELNTTSPVVYSKMKMEPNLFLYLIKQGFDLFGLIEAGLAIDKTTLTSALK